MKKIIILVLTLILSTGCVNKGNLISNNQIISNIKDMIDFINNGKEEDFEDIKKSTNIIGKSKVKIISPITRHIYDIICAGKNYRDHILEIDDFIDMENFK